MSGNINDTNVSKIRLECFDLLSDILYNREYRDKYQYLQNTSPVLYNFILKETSLDTFNQTVFEHNLDSMLILIYKIQKKELTQDEASRKVGSELADRYIPAELLEKRTEEHS